MCVQFIYMAKGCDTMINENTCEEITAGYGLQLDHTSVDQPEMQTAEVCCLVTEEHQPSNTPTPSSARSNLSEETTDEGLREPLSFCYHLCMCNQLFTYIFLYLQVIILYIAYTSCHRVYTHAVIQLTKSV